MKNSAKKINNSGFLDHLVELRGRLLYIIGVIIVCLLALMPFANDIYTILAKPLFDVMPENSTMIAVDVASPFLAPFKLVFLMSVAITIPFTLYQLWAFIAPGLYKKEKIAMVPYFVCSPILFFLGALTVHFFIMPLALNFFSDMQIKNANSVTVLMMPKVSEYLNLITSLIIAFGLCFQLPVLLSLLARVGFITSDYLKRGRKYAVVLVFLIAAFLTPPDLISQIGLAIPTLLLYEISIFIVSMIEKRKDND